MAAKKASLINGSLRYLADDSLLGLLKFNRTKLVDGPSLRDFLRRHPAYLDVKSIQLPLRLERSALQVLKLMPDTVPVLADRGKRFSQSVTEFAVLESSYSRYTKVIQKLPRDSEDGDEDLEDAEKALLQSAKGIERDQVSKKVRKASKYFSQTVFTQDNSILYMVGRLAPNYAIGCRVFYEIRKRCPDFQPRTFFDFGSGNGTLAWAANTLWPNQLKEHFMVEASGEMNRIAAMLMQDGSEKCSPCFPGVYFRQFLPSSDDTKYDLVTSGHSLLFVKSTSLRLSILDILWRKVSPGGFLVLSEPGTKAGFKALMEARKHLLENYQFIDEDSGKEVSDSPHLFAPCPHTETCPKQTADLACTFPIKYLPFNLSQLSRAEHRTEWFSYLIFRKGPTSVFNSTERLWPRVVSFKTGMNMPSRPIHDLCCPSGELERCCFFKDSCDKALFQYAKVAGSGDRFPALLIDGADDVPLLPYQREDPATFLPEEGSQQEEAVSDTHSALLTPQSTCDDEDVDVQ